jgi:AmiR/NasT family two-component response regulator
VQSDAEVVAERLLAVTKASLARRAQLETALHSRIVIEQAKGILAERRRVGIDEAFVVLRRTARSRRENIHAVAAEVVASVGRSDVQV